MTNPATRALQTFLACPQSAFWRDLPFFTQGEAARICRELDGMAQAGKHLLPTPQNIFNAFALTPFESVKAVVLGQDPYPTPGDAHGLAFSYLGTRRLPPSLKTILDEVASDIDGVDGVRSKIGDLTPWAKQGVLLLNTAFTVEAGNAGAHLKLGWSALTDQAIRAISDKRPAVAFLLWGGPARSRAPLIDTQKHLIVESGHPSPLNRHRDFRNSRPFSRTNLWLQQKGLTPIEWRL